MNSKWCNWVLAILLFTFIFIAIPLHYYKSSKREMLKPMFENYVKKHNKSYRSDPDEYNKRFEHFLESMDEIERLNAESRGSDESRARYGLTYLSDMSKEEFKNLHLSDEAITKIPEEYKGDNDNEYDYLLGTKDDNKVYLRRKRASLPLAVDWRDKGVISSVKNQGICGACWAFSTIGTIEAMAAIANNKLQELSVQEMVDCAGYGNSGCSGGDICLLLYWLSLTKTPIELEKAYPLRMNDGVCRKHTNATGVKVKDFICMDMVGNENKIIELLATHGPVTVAVNALTWQNYLGGVIQYHCSGEVKDLNHAVQLIGYNVNTEVPYYIVKNSWGKEFGNDGYLKLAIGNNICGLAKEVASIDVAV